MNYSYDIDEPSILDERNQDRLILDPQENTIETNIPVKKPESLQKAKSQIKPFKVSSNRIKPSTVKKSSEAKGRDPEEDPILKMRQFDTKLQEDSDHPNNDSDLEEEKVKHTLENTDLLSKNEIIEKYNTLQRKYLENYTQNKHLGELIEAEKARYQNLLNTISKDADTDFKDKKLIELTKKNTNLQLQIEKQKLRIKDLEQELSSKEAPERQEGKVQMKSEKNQSEDPNVNVNELIVESKKKVKSLEGRISELRNKNQGLKEENLKLEVILKRELGENFRESDQWKGRFEIIEALKAKIKYLEQQRLTSLGEESSGKKDKVEKNHKFSNNFVAYAAYKKEKDEWKAKDDKQSEQIARLSEELSKTKVRREVLEKEKKSQKEDLTNKLKILIEKSDNDEKLINALNRELEKKTGRSITNRDATFNLQQEVLSLREKLRLKEDLIEDIKKHNADVLELPALKQKLEHLVNENEQLKSKTNDGKVYEALARENAQLRLKLCQLEEELK